MARLTDTKSYLEKIELSVNKIEDWSVLSPKPIVSVWVITYNQQEFIRQTIEGILLQQTSFPIEVVIGEDKSTDQTKDILLEYQKKHPDIIRLRLAKENLYSQNINPWVGVLNACRGKFVALCEGDDYWIDPLKLQKQVDLMQAHPDYSMCFHNAYSLDQASGEMVLGKLNYQAIKPSYTLNDIVRNQFISTAATMLRNGLVPEYQPGTVTFLLATGHFLFYMLNKVI